MLHEEIIAIFMPNHIYKENVAERQRPGRREYRPVRPYAGALLIYYILDVVEVLIGIRFVLRLLAANPASPFTAFIYRLTAPLLAPFRSMFAPIVTAGSVVEWSTLVAMIVYALLAYILVRLIDLTTAAAPPKNVV